MNDPDNEPVDRLDTIFLRVAPGDIALLKLVVEAYEGVAVVRTLDRHAATIVLLVAHDFIDVARAVLADLRRWIIIEELPPPPDMGDDWLLRWIRDPQA